MAGAINTPETTTTLEFTSLPSNQTVPDVKFMDAHQFIWVFVMPFVLVAGIVGNILSVIVLQSKSFRHTTTGVYLPLTAIADIVFLLTGGLEIFEVADVVFSAREYNVWTCRTYKVFHYTSGDVSIWLLVAFTFDRFVAVCFPLSKRRVCTWKRAVIASATIVFLSAAKNVHEFWTRGPEYNRKTGEFLRVCGSQAQYSYFLDYVRPWIAFTLVNALPFIIILFFNCAIVHSLIRAQKVRNAATTTAPTGTGARPSLSGSSFRQTTFMCLGISFAFLVCITPSIVVLIGKPYWKRAAATVYRDAKAVANFLALLNHCVNFFLYCVTGQRFRYELKATLTCSRGEAPQSPITPA